MPLYQKLQITVFLLCCLPIALLALFAVVGRLNRLEDDAVLPPPARDCQRSPIVGEATSGWRKTARVLHGNVE